MPVEVPVAVELLVFVAVLGFDLVDVDGPVWVLVLMLLLVEVPVAGFEIGCVAGAGLGADEDVPDPASAPEVAPDFVDAERELTTEQERVKPKTNTEGKVTCMVNSDRCIASMVARIGIVPEDYNRV